MTPHTLFTTHAAVLPDWIDYNGHMNMGYYLVAFDQIATDGFYDHLGIGIAHKQAAGKSTFSLAANIDFVAELREGAPLRFTTQLVDYDHKRLHFFHSLYHAEEGFLAATNENLGMYIDMHTRRSTTFDEAQMARFQQELERGQALGSPEALGRRLGIRR
ncbi:MAG: thioesterase family protein [Halieaceae bacterium]|jgi:acyl-CoA thioester hydrolase|nr:thioesterase family protein [Halieaceae bacterium]